MIYREIQTAIIGSGLSGLMMGHQLQQDYLIFERNKTINTEISSPFYLHAPIDWLPTKWKEVDVFHNCWDGEFRRIPDIGMMNDYAKKITGKIINTSLMFMDGKPKRGHVPVTGRPGQVLEDIIPVVHKNLLTGVTVKAINPMEKHLVIRADDGIDDVCYSYDRLVSTMPLPILLRMLNMKFEHKFVADKIYSWRYMLNQDIAVDAYQIVNVTALSHSPYRASLMDQ
ncbi:MAG: hypothetical protein V3T23_02360, partial [Nitrososphaerales archaeon]